MKNLTEQKDPFSIHPLRPIILRLPVLAGACATLAILGVIVGWVYTMGYLSAFGGYWLIYQYPTSHFLQMSWPIVLILGMWGIFESKSASEECIDAEKKAKPINLFSGVHWYILAYFLAQLALFLTNTIWHHTFGLSYFIVNLLFIQLALWLLFVSIRQKEFRWDYTTAFIVGFCAVLVFIATPLQLGRQIGKEDFNPTKSTLPIVTLKDARVYGNTSLRLILNVDDRYYLTQLSETARPIIIPCTFSEILEIKR